jgi:hypothetical protein
VKFVPSPAGWQRGVALPPSSNGSVHRPTTSGPPSGWADKLAGVRAPMVRTDETTTTPARHVRLRPDRNKRLPLVA